LIAYPSAKLAGAVIVVKAKRLAEAGMTRSPAAALTPAVYRTRRTIIFEWWRRVTSGLSFSPASV
jgi:hypothetical protein